MSGPLFVELSFGEGQVWRGMRRVGWKRTYQFSCCVGDIWGMAIEMGGLVMGWGQLGGRGEGLLRFVGCFGNHMGWGQLGGGGRGF